MGYNYVIGTKSGSITTTTWFNMNPTTYTLTPGTWLVTASCVFTGTSAACTSVQGAISTSSSAPDSYAARTSIPCAGFTFSATASGTVSFNLTRVFALTSSQTINLLMTAKFSSGTMSASGSSGMAATHIG